MDNISKEERSRVMGLVKQKNTRPEMAVRSFLHKHGFRFRLHDKSLSGKPDIVLPKCRAVVFVHGCFWHGHKATTCKLARMPKSRVRFWKTKILSNARRDRANAQKLKAVGWNVLVVWECEIDSVVHMSTLLEQLRQLSVADNTIKTNKSNTPSI